MPSDPMMGVYFWGFLVLYGTVMYAVSPQARTVSGFFGGTDEAGRPAKEWALTCSIFISWIFAKSVTNAANLGAAHGVVGGLAYAAYWLSIPVAGIVIYYTMSGESKDAFWGPIQRFLTGENIGALQTARYAVLILFPLLDHFRKRT